MTDKKNVPSAASGKTFSERDAHKVDIEDWAKTLKPGKEKPKHLYQCDMSLGDGAFMRGFISGQVYILIVSIGNIPRTISIGYADDLDVIPPKDASDTPTLSAEHSYSLDMSGNDGNTCIMATLMLKTVFNVASYIYQELEGETDTEVDLAALYHGFIKAQGGEGTTTFARSMEAYDMLTNAIYDKVYLDLRRPPGSTTIPMDYRRRNDIKDGCDRGRPMWQAEMEANRKQTTEMLTAMKEVH